MAIAGAGVAGATLAFWLAERGRRVLIVERERVAFGASGTAAGLLSPPSRPDAETPLGRLITRSIELHRELAARIDGRERYNFEPMRAAVVATSPQEGDLLRRLNGDRYSHGAPPTGGWVDRAQWGWVDVAGAAQLDPGSYTQAMVDEAQARGAVLRSGAVEGIHVDGGRARGVVVDGDVIEAGSIVIAMGPWSVEANAWLGVDVPVSPLKGQILKFEMKNPPPGEFSTPNGNYCVRKPSGTVFAGTTEEAVGFDLSPTREAKADILQWLRGLSSRFDHAEPFEQTACLRPITPDGLPIFGEVPGLPGAWLATGHGRKGITLCTATAEALTGLLLDGKSPIIDPAPFSPGRFARSHT